MTRAQVSVEFLIILSVMLLALFVFLSITHEESVVVSKTKMRAEAINAVNDLGAAAE